MLKLTESDGENRTIYIRASSIESFRINWMPATWILTIGGQSHTVQETPEEIIRMAGFHVLDAG